MKEITLNQTRDTVSPQDVLKTVAEHGLCVLPGFVTPEDLVPLNGEFDAILSADSEPGVHLMDLNAGRGADVHLYELEERFPAMQRFFRETWMQEISDAYWEGPAKLNKNIYVMEEIPGTEHVAQDLHFDVQETFKFFLYLNDVTAENGAFSCVPGSHRHTREVRERLGDEISYEQRELSREHPFDEGEVIPIEGGAGTLIVFTTEVWHRAGKVQTGTRRVMRGHTRRRSKPGGERKAKRGAKKKAPQKRKGLRALFGRSRDKA